MAYCGKCGEKTSKREGQCPDCGVKVDKYKEPYIKMTFELITLSLIILLTGIGYLSWVIYAYLFLESNIVIWWHFALMGGFYVLYFGKIYTLKKGGYRSCKKCRNNVGLNSKYCTRCGKKINWSLKAMSKRSQRFNK